MIADLIPKIAAMEAEDDNLPYSPRPSMAGPMHREGIDTRCIRSMVYHAGGFEQSPIPGRAQLVFDDSSWHEELTKDWLRKSIYKVHSEQMEIKVDGRKGKIDWLLTDPMGKDYLVEHKAINHFSFDRVWKGEIPWDYLHQYCDYAHGLQDINPDIQSGFLLFKNKNTSQFIEVWLSYYAPIDQCAIEKMIRSTGEEIKINKIVEWPVIGETNTKFQAVADHVKNKTIPKRPYSRDSWRCDYCRWNEICWAEYEQEFDALADNVAFEGEIVDLCKYYLETNMHEKAMGEEKKKLRAQIVNILEEKQAKKGMAGPYAISWSLRSTERLDESLLPLDVLMAAKKKSIYEVLNIRLRKEKS